MGNRKPEFIEQRRVQLQRYLQMLVLIPGALMEHPEIGRMICACLREGEEGVCVCVNK